MSAAKTMTLVERLKKRSEDCRRSGNWMHAEECDEIAAALESAATALEPFARSSEGLPDKTWLWKSAAGQKLTYGDLRLARSVINMLKGNDHEG